MPSDGGAEQELTFNTNTISGSFQNGFSVGLEAITNGGNDLATLSAIKVYVDMDGTFDPATDPFGTYHLASGNSPDTQGKVIVGGGITNELGQFGGAYAKDGGAYGTWNFTKASSDPVNIDVTVLGIGAGTTTFDYPVGFNIEV